MQVLPISIIQYNRFQTQNNNTTFGHIGQPITLKYAVEKRSYLIPERVLKEAKKLLAKSEQETKSLLEIHNEIYKPLLECKTLEEAQKLFPEFKDMTAEVIFERNTRYAREFKERTDKNFALKMLQEFWAKLKTKDEIAKEIGMKSRSSLDWPLEQIKFISYNPNYKILLRASDVEGNRIIASKTTAWNQAHPDLMYAHNKKATQGCKTEKYRNEQRDRILTRDKIHPERIEKIAKSSQETWDKCPKIKEAMAEFMSTCPAYMKQVIAKKRSGKKLNEYERRVNGAFFKEFWNKHPELKKIYADARKKSTN